MKKTVSYQIPDSRNSKVRNSIRKTLTPIDEDYKNELKELFNILDFKKEKSLEIKNLFHNVKVYGKIFIPYLDIIEAYFEEQGVERIDFTQFISIITGDYYSNNPGLQAKLLFEKFKNQPNQEEISFEDFTQTIIKMNDFRDPSEIDSLFKSITNAKTERICFDGFCDHLSKSTIIFQ